MNTPAAFDQLCQLSREIALLVSVDALLGWDERTKIPAKAGSYRAQQMEMMASLIHQKRTNPRLEELLEEIQGSDFSPEPGSDHQSVVHNLGRSIKRAKSIPAELVSELARQTVLGQQTWSEARKNNRFADFMPVLKSIVELKREEAQAVGFQEHIYDALLDEYEPGAKTGEIRSVLGNLKDQLVPLIQKVADSKPVSVDCIKGHFPVAAQREFATMAAAEIGFDFDRGRLDVTDHPFCTELGPEDCRITTRYDESYFNSAFFGVLHEAGHGIYEQGLRSSWYGLPPGSYCSLGIHESQSRLWENLVGRSRGFWDRMFPKAKKIFPTAFGGIEYGEFFHAIGAISPSLIRVEADEATYNLHIVIRFELELALISGDLQVEDLPGAWKEKYQEFLGISPETDADGCMQDVHWSAGLFGYFATYSLGNIYGSQLFCAAQKELGDLEEQFRQGEFSPLRNWLQTNIYDFGQNFSAGDLVRNATGDPLDSSALIKHLSCKIDSIDNQ